METGKTMKGRYLVLAVLMAALAVTIAGIAVQAFEAGRITIDDNWKTVSLNDYYRNPVVVAKPLSYNGGDPAVVRIRNVSNRSFDIRVQEWDYLDGEHNPESVSYLVIERGRHRVAGGMEVQAGTFTTDATGTFTDVRFSSRFSTTPVVITSVISYNGEQAVVTRNDSVSTRGFSVMMQEQEVNEPQHTAEEIAYIAWTPAQGRLNGSRIHVGRTGSNVNENFSRINFGFGESATVKVDEETSSDSETAHAAEDVGYIAIEESPFYFLADMQTANGGDTANLRYGGDLPQESPDQKQTQPNLKPQPMPKSIIINPPPDPQLNVRIWTNRSTYYVGDNISLLLNVSEEAYVYLLDYDTQGRMRLVFPNRYSQNNKIGPGRYTIPEPGKGYTFTIEGPPGMEHVQALATTKRIDITDHVRNPRDPFGQDRFPLIPDPQGLIQDLSSGLSARFQLTLGGDKPQAQFRLEPVKWDSDQASFWVRSGAQPNQQPVANMSYSPSNPQVGQRVRFDGTGSYDPDGSITQYRWDFDGNGTTDSYARQPSHTYYSGGQYNVRLTVRDNDGATSTSTRTVRVGPTNQSPNASFSMSTSQAEVGDTINFSAWNSYDPDGSITELNWDFDGDGRTDASGWSVTHSYQSGGQYTVTLTVTDNDGATDSSSQSIRIISPGPQLQTKEASSFDANGRREDSWYWAETGGEFLRWNWNDRLSRSPAEAYINFSMRVTNRQGGSGYGATVRVEILNNWGQVVERGQIDLVNHFRPQISEDTGGTGYEAYGSYRIRNPSVLTSGFSVRISWPPLDSQYSFGGRRGAATLAYYY